MKLYKSPAGRGIFPSVTEILKVIEKPYYNRWRHRVGEKEAARIMADAATFGSRLHKVAELVACKQERSVEPDMQPYAAAVREFLDLYILDVLGTELEIVSPKLGFGGTIDLYGQMLDGSYVVVDFKSTGQLTREHGLQVSAYALLLQDAGMRINKRIVVRVKRDKPGTWYARNYSNHAEDVRAFLACKELWYWQKKNQLGKLAKGAA